MESLLRPLVEWLVTLLAERVVEIAIVTLGWLFWSRSLQKQIDDLRSQIPGAKPASGILRRAGSVSVVMLAIVVLAFLLSSSYDAGQGGEGASQQQAAVQAEDQPEQLNIIVFDSTAPQTPLFWMAVDQLKRTMSDCSIDARVEWENRYVAQRTTVYYQGGRARPAAEAIAALLPGNQETGPLEATTLFGIHPDRDIVMMLGQDAGFIGRNLAASDDVYECSSWQEDRP